MVTLLSHQKRWFWIVLLYIYVSLRTVNGQTIGELFAGGNFRATGLIIINFVLNFGLLVTY